MTDPWQTETDPGNGYPHTCGEVEFKPHIPGKLSYLWFFPSMDQKAMQKCKQPYPKAQTNE